MKHIIKVFITSILIFTTILPVVSSLRAFEYSGWVPYWNPVSGLSSIKRSNRLFSEVLPMWYRVNTDGTLEWIGPTNKEDYESYTQEKNIKLIPTIAMFDAAIIHEVFASNKSFNRHIDSIVDEVVENDYDGIDLDYESILLEDKEKYFDFLTELSKRLHDRGKILSVTVLSKWGDDITYGALPQTRAVQDWERISKYADDIRIMTYDYTYQGSTHPGPIGPISWHKMILDYGVTKVPRHKIVMGVHLYAYEWRKPSEGNSFRTRSLEDLRKDYSFNKAESFINLGVERLRRENSGDLHWYEAENFFVYQTDTESGKEDRVLVYPSRKSVYMREKLAESYGIKGVVYWSLGGDDGLLPSDGAHLLQEQLPGAHGDGMNLLLESL